MKLIQFKVENEQFELLEKRAKKENRRSVPDLIWATALELIKKPSKKETSYEKDK